jgi:hypothetical protein
VKLHNPERVIEGAEECIPRGAPKSARNTPDCGREREKSAIRLGGGSGTSEEGRGRKLTE